MPTTLRYQVRMTALSLKTEDDLTNTWHFQVETLPPSATTIEAIRVALQTFYNSQMAKFVGDWSVSMPVKVFNMADPIPRVPITTSTIVVAGWGSATAAMPREVATAISFQAVPLSGTDNRSRRGRIFMPTPLPSQFDGNGLITSTHYSGLASGAGTLLAASDAAADWTWVIFSRKLGTSAPVVKGFVDNAPDVQRRRGRDSTTRALFP